MGEALYRKYRSRSLDEVVGQEHITTTLKNALKSGRISHAYLFTGPRGVGKTSIARILAYEINGMAYSDTSDQHMDIIEIDAASNRRIDEIREIRDKVHIAPTSAKYKVYIIDEVHMLTKEAFNALLKTLEEPPKHAIFILATTEAHKLPETIISRTQRFTFKPVTISNASKHLKTIAQKENITISDEAIELIAKHGDGSFRDSISLLDQIGNLGKSVGVEDIEQLLGVAADTMTETAIQLLAADTPKQVLDFTRELNDSGVNCVVFAKQLSDALRQKLLGGEVMIGTQSITDLLTKLLDVPTYKDPERYFELILLEATLTNPQVQPQATIVTQETVVIETIEPEQKVTPEQPKTAHKKPEPETAKPAKSTVTTSTTAVPFDEQAWNETLLRIKKTHNTLYGIARMAAPRIDGDTLILEFQFAFHQKQLSDQKNQQVIRDIIADVTKKNITLQLEVVPKKAKETKVEPSGTLDTITNIFGGGEVLGD